MVERRFPSESAPLRTRTLGSHGGIVSEPEDLVQIIAGEGVGDSHLLEALRAVPRASFVPANLAGQAYQDKPLSILHHQVTTQPSLVARMVEALALEGSERVLEVGAGYAWQTALLARLCGFVWAVERFGDIAEVARDNLARFGVTNAKVVTGDGTKGLPEHAPYHAILVAAAFQSVPRPLEEQLAAGGRLVQPLGPGGREEVVLFEKGSRGFVRRRTIAWARFVRLRGAYAFPE
jgi:protein-L-isoaspartate(D-aspartate) O-methyltransferase